METLKFFIPLFLLFGFYAGKTYKLYDVKSINIQDTVKIDQHFYLEATMLGYFDKNGTRNPVIKVNKGNRIRITMTNGETMTHDISLEKSGVKSASIIEKGATTSIDFTAEADDIYFCTVPGHRAAGMVGKIKVVKGSTAQKEVVGKLPVSKGTKLNFDFESGDLTDWVATGNAFSQALKSSDITSYFEKSLQVGNIGQYFISSGGTTQYKNIGTLVSKPFQVNYPYASFWVSGGALLDTRVEIVLADKQEVIFQSTGQGRSNLQPVVVDLKAYKNKSIFIRIVDNENGISQIPYIPNDKWAHINFDHFQFHTQRPSFENELFQKDIIILPPLDPVLNEGLSGEMAAKAMTLPDGFKIQLAASEPDIVRPISFTFDARGRLWVVEGHTYPIPAAEGKGKDRILIFEDSDGNGSLDKRKVFMENLNLVSGIEVGMGGVWLCAAPYLLFIPTDFERDVPTGDIQQILDGWGTQDTHEVLNNLRWGPDGWLYGVHGVFTHSKVGKPGTSESERIKINAGVWRLHPSTHQFEVFAEGTSNPWGIDFNDYGHAFITVCVIPHMYHIIQGARYERQAGKSFNPYTYDEIKTIADHKHYVGERGPHAGNFRSASAGGGHAHAGAMIYLGGSSWPAEYRNVIFMNNINGARLNNDLLTRKGSGYVASHKNDFLAMNDSWSQWLNMKYDPSGSVFAIDWYDKNQCHSTNPDVHDKTMGRIFKISYKSDSSIKVNLYKASDMALVNYQLHDNEWFVRNARTILQERGANEAVHNALIQIINNHPDITRKLRALWTLHVTKGAKESILQNLLSHENENIRSWAIQLLLEKKEVSPTILVELENMAKMEHSPLVRLYLTAGLMRMPLEQRWKILDILVKKEEDMKDHNLPLMLWYAAEPLAEISMEKLIGLAESAKMPHFLKYTIQRIGAKNTDDAKKLLRELASRLGHKHENHENVLLIEKLISPKS